MAKNRGYILDRYNGDHAIFIKDKYKPIVIPQKNLGKGLQRKILKDLDLIN